MRRNSLGEGWWIEKGLRRFENKVASEADADKARKDKAAATKKVFEKCVYVHECVCMNVYV